MWLPQWSHDPQVANLCQDLLSLSLALLLHATAEFPPPSCPAQLFLLIVRFLSCPSPGAQDITLMDFYHEEDHQEREAKPAEHTIMEASGNALDTHRAHLSPG